MSWLASTIFLKWWLGKGPVAKLGGKVGLSTGHGQRESARRPRHTTSHLATMGINACTLIYLRTAHNYAGKLGTFK